MQKILMFLEKLLRNLSLFLFVFNFPLTGLTQNTVEELNFNKEGIPYFHSQALFSVNSELQTQLNLYVKIPHGTLSFLKDGDQYVASYEMTFQVFNDKNELVENESQNDLISVEQFVATVSFDQFRVYQKKFELPPSKYTVKIQLRDKNTRKYYESTHPLDWSQTDIEKPFLIDPIIIEPVNRQEKLSAIPRINKIVYDITKGFEVYSEVIGGNALEMGYIIEYSVFEKDRIDTKSSILSELESVQNQSLLTIQMQYEKTDDKRVSVYQKISDQSMPVGTYQLVLTLKDWQGDVLDKKNMEFELGWQELPVTDTDLNTAINQLIYIATSDELENIRAGTTFEERRKRFQSFWNERDPTPQTSFNEMLREYYRRIRISNEKFKAFKKEGWRTDRGMIFVTFGQPDFLENRPSASDTKPYVIWYYYDIHRRYVFVDEASDGDYKLANSMFGESSIYK